MNILMVSDFNFSSLGGVQSSIKSQVDELRNQGHRAVLLCPADDQQYGLMNDDIFYVPSLRFPRVNNHAVASPFGHSIAKLVRDLQDITSFDVVHSQTTSLLGARARLIADMMDIPLVQTMHGRDDVFVERTLRFPLVVAHGMHLLDQIFVRDRRHYNIQNETRTRRLLWDIMLNRAERADAITVPSHHFAKKFITKGADQSKFTVIPNGIPDDIIAKVKPMGPKAATAGISLVWAGRLSAEKQPDMAIRASAHVQNCTLDVYGDGLLMNACKKLIHDLNVEDRVSLKGVYKTNQIYDTLKRYDAMVYTSYNFDTQGIVLLEASIAGVPVIYCDPDLAESLPEGSAVLTDANTALSLSKSISNLAASPDRLQQSRKLIMAAREGYRQSLQTSRMVELYTAIRKRTQL